MYSNRPKTPRGHAAHYEVAKTERWCYKHNCHIIRESACDKWEGTNRATRGNLTRVNSFNRRIERVRGIVRAMGDKKITIKVGTEKTFYVENGWLKYRYEHFFDKDGNSVNTKSSSDDRYLDILEKELNINIYPF